MRPRTSICLALILIFFLQGAVAMETDQYNLPPVALADIGDEVSEYLEDNLKGTVAKINTEIAAREACLGDISAKNRRCASLETERKKLIYLRSNDAVVQEVYKRLGDGNIFVSYIGKWMNTHTFRSSPSRYKTSYLESIYIAKPIDYSTLSPTVRLFGVEFGTDKLDHIFQQGYKYFTIREEGIATGLTPTDAEKKAVKWGQMTERTYFGLLISGVYSNADLEANYVGMRFYQGLTETLSINGKTRPATLILKDGIWKIGGGGSREDLIKPFITEHLNEALNPSGYAFTIYGSVRHMVRKYGCPDWKQTYPMLTAAALADKSKELESWNREDYGYTKRDRSVRVGEVCFSQKLEANRDSEKLSPGAETRTQ